MKNKWKAIRVGLLLFTLPLVATAAVSANQWMNDNSPIELNNVDSEVITDNGIGVDRVHTVALNATGAVEGRIAEINTDGSQGISGLTVYFLSSGKIAGQTKTAADGSFVVQGLQEGPYSFVATGQNGYAAYGVHVVGETAGTKNVMEAAAVSPNLNAVREILSNNLPEQVVSEIVANASNATPKGANRVKLVDGVLSGNVFTLTGGKETVGVTTVNILQNNEKIATVETDSNGSFKVSDLEPGIYGFVATGPNGFAAVSFEAVESSEIPVSIAPTQEPSDSFDISLASGSDVSYGYDDEVVVYEFAPIEYVGESVGVSGAGGSYAAAPGFQGAPVGGGGGGGPGFGRLGRVALIGGAVAGIIALADDNETGPASNANPN